MALIAYQDWRPSAKSLLTVQRANEILKEYAAHGLDLTLRQLYYQFVARGLIPNKQTEYKKLGDIISNARLAGMISWKSIVDRTRFVRTQPHWDSPADIISACASQYKRSKWADQDNHVEVWIEKDALIGVIEDVCREFDVPHFSCRGYVSQSEMWESAQRLRRAERDGKETTILHLGDHDPSGIDMTRDIRDRLWMFGAQVDVRRIALTMDQVEELNPPPNPAKITDSRADDYIARFGSESWELDAIEPKSMIQLIRDQLEEFIDNSAWDDTLEREEDEKKSLKWASDNWDRVEEMSKE